VFGLAQSIFMIVWRFLEQTYSHWVHFA